MRPGTCLGDRYVLGELVGTGDSGSVWFGHDTVVGRSVRIKVLDPELARDDSVRARFRRTALAVASLDVPGIAEVHDCVEERDGDTITVCQIGERFDGEPLRHKLLTGRTFADEDALALVAGLARSLHAAHQRGLVHLNLRSSNVLISPAGEVRIVDFGFQDGGDAADDVHALGALAYECLSGAKPFEVEPDAPPGEQERQPQPLPSTVAPAVTVFVKRALSRRPDERFTTAARLAAECEQINHTNDVLGALLERSGPEPEPEPGPGLGSRLGAALAPAEGLAAAAPPAEPDPAAAVAEVPPADGATQPRPGSETEPAGEPEPEPAGGPDSRPVAGSDPSEPAAEPAQEAVAGPADASEPDGEPLTALRPAATGDPDDTAAVPRKRPRRRLALVAVAALLLAFAGTAVAVTLFPGGLASSTGDGSVQGVAEPQDTSLITTGDTSSETGDRAANDPTESDSGSESPKPSSSSDDDDNGDGGGGGGGGDDEPDQVSVPNVVGDDAGAAYNELRGAGLNVEVDRSGRGDHACRVHDQNPNAGTTVDKGSTVVMSVRMVRNPNQCEDGGGGGDDDD